jgi:hypothetical protein
MYSVAGVGMVARFIGVILGLVSVYMVWKGNKSSFQIRKMVATALALESVYYASLIPSVIWLFALGSRYRIFSYTLGIGYFLQVLLTVPFLTVLAIKVYKYGREPNGFQSWKWVGIAFCGYIVALWANAVFRWFDTALAELMAFLLGGSTGVLAWNAFILMSLAVVFAVFGGYSVWKQKISVAIRWLGLVLVLVGLHYILHVLFYYLDGSLISVWLTDVWAIPLLGLGISLLKMKINTKKHRPKGHFVEKD